MSPPVGSARAGVVGASTGAAIPASVVHHYPGDEGSGTTLTDNAGSANITLNGPTWQANANFEGGQAIHFDNSNDYATGSLTQPNQFTWMLRVAPDNLSGSLNFRFVISHNGSPQLFYNNSNEEWELRTNNPASNIVSDAQSTAQSETRIFVARYNGTDSILDVYDGNKNPVGSATNTDTLTWGNSTTYLGQLGDGTRWFGGQMDPQLFWHDKAISDSTRDDMLSNQY